VNRSPGLFPIGITYHGGDQSTVSGDSLVRPDPGNLFNTVAHHFAGAGLGQAEVEITTGKIESATARLNRVVELRGDKFIEEAETNLKRSSSHCWSIGGLIDSRMELQNPFAQFDRLNRWVEAARLSVLNGATLTRSFPVQPPFH